MPASQSPDPAARDWLQSPQGRYLLAAETVELRRALENVFGDQLLQIGPWGGGMFLKAARTRRTAVVAEAVGDGVQMVSRADELADCIGLRRCGVTGPPAGRACRAPRSSAGSRSHPASRWPVDHCRFQSLWNLGVSPRVIPTVSFPPGAGQSDLRATSARLAPPAEFERSSDSHFYYFQLTVRQRASRRATRECDSGGLSPRPGLRRNSVVRQLYGADGPQCMASRHDFWPPFGACYITTARKEMYTVTPVRPGLAAAAAGWWAGW